MQGEKSIRFGIRASLILFFIIAIVIGAGILAVFNFFEQRRTVISYTRGALEMLVATGAPRFSGEDILRLSSATDYQSPEYARAYDILKRIYVDNRERNLRENSLYIVKPRPGTTDKKVYIFAAHLPGDADKPFQVGSIDSMSNAQVNYIGNPYVTPPAVRAQIRKLLKSEMAANSTGVYATPRGEWISAFAPILNKEGRKVAVLQADYRFEDVEMQILLKFTQQLGMIGLATLIAIVALIFFSRRFTRPIHAIAHAVDRVADGDFNVRVEDVDRRDELGSLGRHFNTMTRVLEEKTRLSRYVSAETVRKIEAGDGSGGSKTGERVRVCCFFSDIRGFTRYTADSPAEWVVSILNSVLKCQTDIILANGGSVDKFIGDEVMAVFEGEDMLERALKSAHEIQNELEPVRTRENLNVGIGIRTGEVIRGDIGAEQRTDFTIIGTTVNMASRLCSAAKAGQILITREDHKTLGGGFTGKYIGRGRFKGIAEPIPVYDMALHPDGDGAEISPSA